MQSESETNIGKIGNNISEGRINLPDSWQKLFSIFQSPKDINHINPLLSRNAGENAILQQDKSKQ